MDELEASLSPVKLIFLSRSAVLLRVFARFQGGLIVLAATRYLLGGEWIEMTLGKSPTALRFSLPCLPVKRRSNTTAYQGYRMALVFSVCLAWP